MAEGRTGRARWLAVGTPAVLAGGEPFIDLDVFAGSRADWDTCRT